jgi:hypothetical protein
MTTTGRPSKYDPAYCDRVILHMADGASLTSFAGEIEVARSTINEWMEHHPEFSEAVNIAKAKCAGWWENVSRKNAKDGGGNATLCVFGLKNMGADDWREKVTTELTGSIEVTSKEQRDAAVAAAIRADT